MRKWGIDFGGLNLFQILRIIIIFYKSFNRISIKKIICYNINEKKKYTLFLNVEFKKFINHN